MSVAKPKALTWRVTEIPKDTTKEELVHLFDHEDRDRISIGSLFPDAEGGNELTATLLYQPHPDRPDEGPKFAHGKPKDISIDKDFEHWTTLYCPPAGTIIAADIIAVTGLAGHAFGSWAHSEENMWLRDEVYKFAPNARVLTYGYSTLLFGPYMSIVRMSHLSDAFYENLINMREDSKCEQRPIIFIGHSLGCMIIKKAMIIARERNVVSSRLPVRSIIFLAAPHRGMDVTALQNVVKNLPPEQLVEELRPESETLKSLNEGFSRTAQDVDILTCYETLPTKTVAFDEAKQKWTRSGEMTMILNPSSAHQYWPKETRILAFADHSTIAKLKKNRTIFPNVRRAISRALIPTAQISGERHNDTFHGRKLAEATPSGRPKPYAFDSQSHEDRQQEQYRQSDVERIDLFRSITGSSGYCSASSTINEPQPEERDAISYESQPPWLSGAPDNSWDAVDATRAGDHVPARFHDQRAQRELPDLSKPPNNDRSYAASSVFTRGHNTSSRATREPVLSQFAEPPDADLYNQRHPPLYVTGKSPHGSPPQLRSAEMMQEFEQMSSGPGNLDDNNARPQLPTLVTPPSQSDLGQQLPVDRPEMSHNASIERMRSEATIQELENMSLEQSSRSVHATLLQPPTLANPPPSESDIGQPSVTGLEVAHHASMQELRSAATIQGPEKVDSHFNNSNDYPSPPSRPFDLVTAPKRIPSDQVLSMPGNPSEEIAEASFHPIESAKLPHKPARFCDGCDEEVLGLDYHCLDCPNWNYCYKCFESKLASHPKHKFETIVPAEGVDNADLQDSTTEGDKSDKLAQAKCSKCEAHIVPAEFFYQCLECPLDHFICQVCQKDSKSCLKCTEPCQRRRLRRLGKEMEIDAWIDLESDIWIDPDPSTQDSALVKALKTQDVEELDILVHDETPLKAGDDDGCTPLHIAAHLNLDVGAKFLMMHGAGLDVKDTFGRTPLCLAVLSKNEDLALLLLQRGADRMVVDGRGNNILHLACAAGCEEVVRAILEPDKERNRLGLQYIDALNDAKRTPLFLSCEAGKLNIAKFLLAVGADPNASDGDEATQLGELAYSNHSRAVVFLLDHGAAVDSQDKVSRTPLFRAASGGNFALCQTLMKRGADPNALARKGSISVLGAAAIRGRTKTVEALLLGGADIKGKDSKGHTALHSAVEYDKPETCNYLLKQGADPNSTSKFLHTPLHLASQKGFQDTAKLLIEYGAKLEAQSQMKNRPLHFAADAGKLDLCKLLLKSGADANAWSNNGGTVISIAARNGHLDIVKYLVQTMKIPAKPPSGKWKYLRFSDSVNAELRSEILAYLRAHKHDKD